MSLGLLRRGSVVGGLALLISAGLPVAVGAQQSPAPETAQEAPLQAVPGDEPVHSDPLPPPILPAPDLPIDDPVVELPPAGEAPPVAGEPGAPAVPGLPTNAAGAPFSFADLAEELLDSVVYISTSQRVAISRNDPVPDAPNPPDDEVFEDFFDDNSRGGGLPRSVQSLDSGFVIDPSGLIVTNNHVIADADEITANFADGRKLTAEVVGVDDKTDLAVLKVTPRSPLEAARFGRSDALRVGDWVIAIGNPFGFGGTVTAGIVSALDRNINSGPYDHYIQTDASINRGNSGGPLFNLGGEVVGINTAIMSPTGGSIGIGFAVPSEIAVPVIEQLREFGEVRRGWIGVRIQEVTEDFAEGVGMKEAMGALIAGLTGDGPAEKAGIKAGDIVIQFAGKAVEDMRSLPQLVADTPPGDVVEVTVMRDGKEVKLQVEVGLLDEEQIAAAATKEPKEGDKDGPAVETARSLFGLTLGPITDEARQTYAIDDGVKGVLVTGVETGSEAAEKNVKAGDVIVQVSQRAVSKPDDVTTRVEQLKSEGRRTVMFLVSGAENKLRFVSLRMEEAQ